MNRLKCDWSRRERGERGRRGRLVKIFSMDKKSSYCTHLSIKTEKLIINDTHTYEEKNKNLRPTHLSNSSNQCRIVPDKSNDKSTTKLLTKMHALIWV